MNISKQGDLEIRYYIPRIRNGAISSFFLSSRKGNPQVIIDVSYIGKQTTEKIFFKYFNIGHNLNINLF